MSSGSKYIEIYAGCFVAWIWLQATFSILTSVLYEFSVPWSVWGALAFVVALQIARVPPPSDDVVREVLGANPFSSNKEEPPQGGDSKDKENDRRDKFYCMRVVGHRGAAFDYPENSITAIRNVRTQKTENINFLRKNQRRNA